MTALLTANRCPACQNVHGQPTTWPTCPHHGHWLYVLRSPLRAGGPWAYACHAPRCTHIHTQEEKAVMTTTQDGAALAIRSDQQDWTPQQLAAFAQIGIEDASDADRLVFLHRCQATGLDPFTGQITMISRNTKDATGKWVKKWTIQTGIDGYRVIAHRAAAREGAELTYGPTVWFDAAGGPHDIWLGDDPPSGAMVTIFKNGQPFTGIARYKSFVQTKQDGTPMAQWAVMPDHLLAKCAEAQAFRRAFPFDLQDITTADEAAAPPAPAPAPLPPVTGPKQSQANADAMRKAINDHLYTRLGVTDPQERSAYVHNLANKQVGDPITDADVRTVYALLTEKEDGEYVIKDIGGLVELTSPDAEIVGEDAS